MKIVLKFQMQCRDSSISAMGNFNQVMNNNQDRLNVQKGLLEKGEHRGQTRFANSVKEMGLYYTWRMRNRDINAFSCLSRTHDKFSCLDMLLCNKDIMPFIQDITSSSSVIGSFANFAFFNNRV